MSEEDSKNGDLKAIQKIQNKMARFLNGTKVLLEQANLLSVNQLNAKIKLQEVCKAINIEDYPIKITQLMKNEYKGHDQRQTH